ncbi:hypothetical protein CC1G_10115 [Coprinopsis cinerea okayama7|uniref:F-box domain-containing protein n=1 Tax=Coprinopsis cinerea (strain Okayama-7 / 130 / ATCC MYA-4618 / FGSC 9003) TaxID=240176 RepID=A8N412_COPC7|nr:hypothetical protein CC1G_10115 [Coprinopsis cinerea okayama7\|eukprot:XP_001829585.2 hypothetical protein CC1G_10115 [Coprinopsis cinerea okayama7\
MSYQALLTSFEVVGNWVHRLVNYATRRDSTTQRPRRLTSLPYELLIGISISLEWRDILQLRQTCRLLNQVSRERSVWLALLYRYYETKFARPFFLPKPLHLCSASDLENRITRWWRGLDGIMVSPVTVHRFKPLGLDYRFGLQGPVPGGRFLFYAFEDGRLGYIDSRQPNPEFIDLIPSPSAFCGNPCTDISVAIDALSQQQYTPDHRSAPPLCSQLFPSTFNIAVHRMIWKVLVHFEVWRLTAQIEGEDVVGYSATLLTSFTEDHTLRLWGPCALYGKNLAYNISSSHSDPPYSSTEVMTIVDWTEIPQGAADFPRSYIPVRTVFDTIYLLPGNIILAVADHDYQPKFFAWNWVEDSTLLSVPPSSPAVAELPSCPPMAECSPGIRGLLSFTNPYFTRNSIRLVLATDNGAFGVILPITTSGRKQSKCAFQIVKLFDMAGLNCARFVWYGYNSGFSLPLREPETSWHSFHYRWPDDDVDGPSMSVCNAPVPSSSFPCYYHGRYIDDSQASVSLRIQL